MSGRSHLVMTPYYFPPSGMGGVQRPLKFARYLPEFGWDVTIVTPEPGRYLAADESLLAELPASVRVERVRTFDPVHLLRSQNRSNRSYKPYQSHPSLKAFQQLLRWPDDKRAFVSPAVRRAASLAAHRPFDAIWTSSPPPSAHLIGLRLRKRLAIPWVADFRDPWLYRFDDWGPTRFHARYSRNLRARIAATADRVIAVSETIAASLTKGTDIPSPTVIYNGYDEADFVGISPPVNPDSVFTILLYGTFGTNPDPAPLFAMLLQWLSADPNRQFRVLHVGASPGVDLNTIAARHGLGDRFESYGYRPHQESLEALMSAGLIALPDSTQPEFARILPGRIFEMLRSLRPILLLAGAGSEPANLLRTIEGCWIVPLSDTRSGLAALNEIARLPRNIPARSIATIKRFERREQTRQLASILDELKSAHLGQKTR